MEDINLSELQLDALKEIGNIGAGNAAIALSQLLNKKVMINVPKISLINLNEISESEFVREPQEVSIAVSLNILGALKGQILVLFPRHSALLMIDILLKRTIGVTQLLTPMDTSIITECSHILSSSYLNAVGEFLMVHRLTPLVSQVAIDKMERLSKFLIKGFSGQPGIPVGQAGLPVAEQPCLSVGQVNRYILPIENHMVIEDKEVDLFVTFLLEYEDAKKILGILGL